MKFENALDLVGKTPVVRLRSLTDASMAKVYLKLEGNNLTGSTKVRPALYMIEGAIREGLLKKGMGIIEPTSGNMGIALALIGKMKGFKVSIVMPDTMSVERRALIKAYGADLILTDGSKGMSGAIAEAERLNRLGGYYMPAQFSNAYNVLSHYETTGLEIAQTFEQLDAFVSSVGTGGTISGAGKRLKESYQSLKVYAVEPEESKVLSGQEPGPHKIQGIGAGFVPDVLNTLVYDEIIRVENEDAFKTGKEIARSEGILVGISSGAATWAAIEIAKRSENAGKTIVVLLPDTGDRYLSTPLFTE